MTADQGVREGQAHEHRPCEHYWVSHHQPDFPPPIHWVRVCGLCGEIDGEDLVRELAPLVEWQRKVADALGVSEGPGLEEALREHEVSASRNLGQYRTEIECDCAATWITDGHSSAPQPDFAAHLADTVRAWLRGER